MRAQRVRHSEECEPPSGPVSEWLQALHPDRLIVIHNDHMDEFLLDAYPSLAPGVADSCPRRYHKLGRALRRAHLSYPEDPGAHEDLMRLGGTESVEVVTWPVMRGALPAGVRPVVTWPVMRGALPAGVRSVVEAYDPHRIMGDALTAPEEAA